MSEKSKDGGNNMRGKDCESLPSALGGCGVCVVVTWGVCMKWVILD